LRLIDFGRDAWAPCVKLSPAARQRLIKLVRQLVKLRAQSAGVELIVGVFLCCVAGVVYVWRHRRVFPGSPGALPHVRVANFGTGEDLATTR
jgi:hypothetical protein